MLQVLADVAADCAVNTPAFGKDIPIEDPAILEQYGLRMSGTPQSDGTWAKRD